MTHDPTRRSAPVLDPVAAFRSAGALRRIPGFPRAASGRTAGRLALWLVLPVLAACGADSPGPESGGAVDLDRPEHGGVAVICTQSDVERLNPFVSPELVASDLRPLLFTPLVRYADDSGFAPALAEQWEWDDERRSLRLRIRDDVAWHDGEPVTADDVAWTIRTAADPAYGYWLGTDLRDVRAAERVDDRTVDVRFAGPFTAGLEPFALLTVLPRHLLGDMGAEEFAMARYHRQPVGNGPFRLTGRGGDGALQFDRVDGYPEALGRPHLERVVFRSVPEPAAVLVALSTRTVDACATGPSLARETATRQEIRSIAVSPGSVQAIPFNVRVSPLDDARVRRALSAALEREAIAAVVSPLAEPARTFLPHGTPWIDPAAAQPDADSALAVTLLEEAGWRTVGRDGIRTDSQGRPLRFSLVSPRVLEPVLTVVQAQLRRAGVDLRLEFMEASAYFAMLREPDRRPAAMALNFTPDRVLNPDPGAQLHSDGGSNLSFYSNARVDALIERLRVAVAEPDRAEIYRELQQRAAEDVPTLYTIYLPRLLSIGPRLQGVAVDRNGPFASIADWWIPAAQRRGR